MKNRYAFVRIRTNHSVVRQLVTVLAYAFPDFECDTVDVKRLLLRRPGAVLWNMWCVATTYGVNSFFSGKSRFYNRFFGTPFMFKCIKDLLQKKMGGKGYLFTFQDNSLFDGSVRRISHFVYTDHTVLENRNYPGFDEKKDLLVQEWLALERTIYGNAKMVFTRYDKIRGSIVDDYGCNEEKVKCIYYAPYVTVEGEVVDKRKYDSKRILFVGSDWDRKGGPQLLEAFEQVLDKLPDAQLTIAGCKPTVSLRNVQTVGKINKEMLSYYYESAAVFCLPTYKEHAGVSCIEAMGHRLPIIGARIGAIPEYVQDGINGYLVDVGDTKSLVQRLIELLSDPDKCAAMGASSAEAFRQNFTIEVMAGRLRMYIEPHIV